MLEHMECDALVAGSGAGGLSAAIAMAKAGLDVLVVEKAEHFGGTTALSGGVLWVPGNRWDPQQGDEARAMARRYLDAEAGDALDSEAVEQFLQNAPRMVAWFERETCVRFGPTQYPDYHPDQPGGAAVGRSILAQPFDIRALGADMARLRLPLKTITFMGMMFNSSNADLKHFFNATRSLRSFAYVARRLVTHLCDMLRYRRAVQVTSGNALAARLARSALDAGVPIWTSTPIKQLLMHGGAVVGAEIERGGSLLRVHARHGVVLACGGFPHDQARTKQTYPHLRRGGRHLSPTPAENTGDGIRLAEQAGGVCQTGLPNAAAWMPVSRVPFANGEHGLFPHLLDRYKPGVIGVNQAGHRFCNESNSYHDVGAAMVRDGASAADTTVWLICDRRALRAYGLGVVKPAPVPIGSHLRSGYLTEGRTLAELAQRVGIDPAALQASIDAFNADAAQGQDPLFGRGSSAFNRYLADPEHAPNPCVAPIVQAPFYAVQLHMGDLGTFEGLKTTVSGAVRTEAGSVIAGLYAVGNDRLSVMAGHYPAAGITLGPAMTFGWMTGRHIAQAAQTPFTSTSATASHGTRAAGLGHG
ncbi:FAD-dependent oxidoreductase [Hydrogenophaga sp.]|uniref:FAD-dependent oxidoreductase n=1 Tax=Hydrogenophaga sp. TaxID=1904254 RepID=UPI00356346CD